MADLPERDPVTIRLSNLTQTDATPLLSLPVPPLPDFGVGGVLRSTEQDAEVEEALASDPVALQQAVELLRNVDLSYLCALGPSSYTGISAPRAINPASLEQAPWRAQPGAYFYDECAYVWYEEMSENALAAAPSVVGMMSVDSALQMEGALFSPLSPCFVATDGAVAVRRCSCCNGVTSFLFLQEESTLDYHMIHSCTRGSGSYLFEPV